MLAPRCQVDLSTLSKEQTHKLELPLEEGEGFLVLLVTLTASATVSISDLSVNALEDQKEQEEILRRYVCSALTSVGLYGVINREQVNQQIYSEPNGKFNVNPSVY